MPYFGVWGFFSCLKVVLSYSSLVGVQEEEEEEEERKAEHVQGGWGWC